MIVEFSENMTSYTNAFWVALDTFSGSHSELTQWTGTHWNSYYTADPGTEAYKTYTFTCDRAAAGDAETQGYLNGSTSGAYSISYTTEGNFGAYELNLCARNEGSYFFGGKIAELICYSVVHDATKLSTVHTYLKTKYGHY
jgi:hypothetical protein